MSGWGVSGGDTRTITRIGDTVYVGGMFTGVRAPGGAETGQAYLAAFDAVTGQWINSFRPTFDDIVRDVASSADGSRLFVAGHFRTVNGVSRRGLVSLNPNTGAVDTGFNARLTGNGKAVEVHGRDVFVAGSFGRLSGGVAIPRLAKVDSATGVVDAWWRPFPDTGPEGLSIPPSGDRLYLAGPESLAGVENPFNASISAVDLITGARIASFNPARNVVARDVDSTNERVFVAHGGSNRFAVYDAATGADVRVYTGDGDFQRVELIGRRAFVGSHSHFLNATARKQIAAVDWDSGDISLSFDSEVSGGRGVRAIYGAGSQLHLGGQITLVGDVSVNGSSFARIGPAPGHLPPSQPTGLGAGVGDGIVTLSWSPSSDDGAVTGYRVLRHGTQIAVVAGTSYTDTDVVPGVSYRYEVEAIDDEQTLSATSAGIDATPTGTPPPPLPGTPTLSPFVVSRSGDTYTATSLSSPEVHTGSLKHVVETAANRMTVYGGGELRFEAGEFDLGSDHFEFENLFDIQFTGAGIDLTRIINSSIVAADTEVFDITGGTRLAVRDLAVLAGGPARTTSDAIDFDNGNQITVERVRVEGSRGRGIVFDGKGLGWTATQNTVSDCEIRDVPGDGIELLGASNNTITGCTITDVGGHGIQVAKASPTADQPNLQSNDNTLSSNTIIDAGRDGINILSSDGTQLLDNTVLNSSDDVTSRDGIRIESFHDVSCNDTALHDNVATDNQAVPTQRYGLNIASALCNDTIVGVNNFAGNRVGDIRDLGTNTQYVAPPDTEAPQPPTDVSAVSNGSDEVQLSWSPGTDNVAIASYEVERNGVIIDAVPGTATGYTDSTVGPGTTYSYVVYAVDTSANWSAPSAPPAVVTTPVPGGSLTLDAVADTYVAANRPTTNYGTSTALRADASPETISYLRFNVIGVSPATERVVLQLTAQSRSSVGFDVRAVADTTWGEYDMDYTSAPAVGTIVGSSGPFDGGDVVEVDLTDHITGDGLVSLALTTTSSTAFRLGSRTSTTPPALLIDNEGDTTAPSIPDGVSATAISHEEVLVTWSASTDDTAVTGYTIRRDGTEVGTVGGTVLSFSDTTVAPATTYAYTVEAFDAAANTSAASSPPASVTTPPIPAEFEATLLGDTYVNAASPDRNYGSSNAIRLDASPDKRGYLLFDMGTLASPPSQVILRLHVDSNHTVGFAVHEVTDTSWDESVITYNTAPTVGALVATTGPVTAGAYVDIDVTAVASAGGKVSFALVGGSATALKLSSSSGANPPLLVVSN